MGFQFWGKIDFLGILHYTVYYIRKEKSSIILNFCYTFFEERKSKGPYLLEKLEKRKAKRRR